MGPGELKELIAGKRLAVEMTLFILALEDNRDFPLASEFFRILSSSKATAYTSVLTVTEALTKSYELNSLNLIPDRLTFIAGAGLITVVDVSRAIALKAAELRAKYRLKTPDAIHLATALEANCELFLTTDKDFTKAHLEGLKILLLPTGKE